MAERARHPGAQPDLRRRACRACRPRRYRVGKDVADPVAILVRSADLHAMAIPPSVRAIGRAGAGTNNIPVEAMSARGVPVFNAPGANANAVKELVLAGMLMAARQIAPALRFVGALDAAGARPRRQAVEDGKKAFAGIELAGQHARHRSAWARSAAWSPMRRSSSACRCSATTPTSPSTRRGACRRRCERATSVNEVLKAAQFVTLHVPLVERDAPPRSTTPTSA